MSIISKILSLVFGKDSDEANAGNSRGNDNVPNSDLDPYDPFPEPIRLEITDVFDLHSIPPHDVGRIVVEYLEQARTKGFKSVRIVHGKGVGVQRDMVRKILALTPFIISYSDAPPQSGGWGATVAHLSKDKLG